MKRQGSGIQALSCRVAFCAAGCSTRVPAGPRVPHNVVARPLDLDDMMAACTDRFRCRARRWICGRGWLVLQAQRDRAIGVLGGIELSALREFLPANVEEHLYDQITGATPVNLLCRELLRRGRRLVVFSLSPSIESEHVFKGEHLRIHLGPVKSASVRNGFRDERRFLRQAIRGEKLACLHAHWIGEYALAASDSGLPHIVTAHDAPVNCLWQNLIMNPLSPYRLQPLKQVARGNAFWFGRTWISYLAARRAQRVVAVSPYVADHLRRYGFHRKSIEVIPNGMPGDYFARQRHRTPGDPITFATALGNWAGLKNPASAIAAFARVKERLPHSRMLMFGAGFMPDGPAAAWARARGWDCGIEFKGQVPHDEVMNTLCRCVDVLVHPSLEEAHPMPLIEAMSFGIPVVAGRGVGGVPWTLGEGTGLLVDVRNPEAIAPAMLELARDDALRSRLGTASRDEAQRRFRLDRMTDRYESIYAELASGVSAE
jgi:glycosyltransferase involved in cell wall biosynthesis